MAIEETLSENKERLWLNDNGVCVARFCVYAYEIRSNCGLPVHEFSLQDGVKFDNFVRDVRKHLNYNIASKVSV